ncbi:ciliogenesis and planar polarity effector 1 isoform X2 [Triplophysa rosa]|uniref:ciliogenesis and planar polarity effector 1 isoform X2 n=1 Tax=Triplophysa rosa TaxID=992332 RepID=UPI002545ED25|nr:ciliogenesis and planar polarity effector 1 isoform X2 [Triplophysa rosa]
MPRMELKLEVLLSSSIKRKKPWPRFCWLGKEKEAVFLLDDNRLSEIHLVSGRTKKKTPKLQPLLQRVVTMSASPNGMWLVGLLVSGELFLWNKDKDSLKMVSAFPAVHELASSIRGTVTTVQLSLLVSENGQRVFLAALTGQVFLWECSAPQDLSSPRDITVKGRWSEISHPESTQLPSSKGKEASVHSVFVKNQAVGDVCLSVFVFSTEEQLTITFLKIRWEMIKESKHSSAGFTVHWVSKSYLFDRLVPPCRPVKSRGALVPALSPDGQLLAIVLNQKDPRVTQVLFVSTQNFVTVSSLLGGCGLKAINIPAKYVRSYWVGSVSWTPEGLYLVCVLKRGSLLMLARLGGLVSLSTTGCNIEFGPAHFLPLHPLVTYRPPAPLHTQDGSLSSSSASLCDPMRQRYSITCHPRQPLLIVSDGYMVTVLRLPRRPSATAITSALLLHAAQGLENIRWVMGSSSRVQPQVRSRLESMSTLMFTGSLLAFKETEPPLSTLPLYLQDTGDTERAQGEEDDDDSDDGLHSRMESEGKLEFASMFDTLHAHAEDPKPTSSAVQEDLTRVYRNLLTVWALAVSLRGAVEQRERLLKYTITCVVRLINLLRVSAFISRKNQLNWVTCTLRILRTLLSFLPWDTTRRGGSSCLPVAVELSRRFVEMFLPSSDVALSSHNFNAALLVLREASHSVNLTYSMQSRALHYGKDDQVLCSSDLFAVRLLHEDTDINTETMKPTARDRSLPSNRLVVIWRDVYRRALKYQMMLNNSKCDEGIQPECEKMSIIIPEIQKVLQTAGDRLEDSHALRNVTGEELFILGEYTDSVRVWRAELCAEREKGPLTCYLETRYSLALLYGHLFQYHLREAQGLCDRLTRQLQPHTGHQEEMPGLADDPIFDGWFLGPVGREAALAVVQSLARFMAAYFTNRPLCILPPHSVEVLPALHLPHDAGRRVVELSRSRVVVALRSQHLSDVWTVDYALELLLLGGLLPEAAWMAQHLGDWKMAATLSLAYSSYCSERLDMSSLRWRELHLPTQLHPAVIFQTQLEMLLGRAVESEGNDNTDPACVEDVELLQVSVQEILKASVMAEVDVFSQPLKRLLESAKERATSLPVLLPAAFYLPAPPLYCPQPSPDTQETRSAHLDLERDSRCQLSGLIQKVLLLFRAAHSSRPTAQWYIRKLHHCRHLLHKIRKKASEPNFEFIPEGLKKFSSHRGFFQSGSRKDVDGVTVQTIICFRELCALCWMLHARDQLTISCRRYQSVRNQQKDAQISDVSVADLCVEALGWACRLLPFCRFLNAEEALQDLVLSLVAELPPSHVMAETLARVFPEEEESVRVPLREKYTSLVQRLRPVSVSDTTADVPSGSQREDVSGESMMILIRDQLRRRRRELRRLEKHLAAAEQFLWEREEEDERGGADSILKRLSLGTSLSDSTLTDCGHPLVYSEGDTAETPSETLSPEPQTKTLHGSRTAPTRNSPTHEKKENKRSNLLEPEGTKSTRVEPTCLPTVGTWEFELEDKEYALFLELFLSYVLEKDSLDAEDSELPLLSSFSKQLHTKELHSVTFDMLTTLKRCQRDGYQTGCEPGARLPLFRAGRCFQTVPVTPEPPLTIGPASSVQSNAQIATNATPVQALPGVGKQQGLFGLGQQAALMSNEVKANLIGSEVRGSQSSLPFESWAFKILSPAELDVQVQLDSMLESRFPQLARLLEWMMRWADRRVLLPWPIRMKSEGSSDSVVIRAKATTPAVLFALELLEPRYTAALLATDKHDIGFKRSITDRRKDGDRSVDTGYPASAGTPVILPDLDAQHTYSHDTCEVEDVVDQTDSQLSEEEDVISDIKNNITAIRGEIRRSPVAEDDESSFADATEATWLSSNQERAPREAKDQALTLADLESLHTNERSEDSLSEGNHISCGALDRDAPVEARRREASDVQQSSHVMPEEGMRRTEGQSCSHPPGSDPPRNRAETQTDPVRQLLQDELFRLVQLQQINFMSLMQVVGASFSNLPLSQHNPLQSNVMLSQTAVTSAPPPCDHRSEPTHGQTQNIQPASCDGPKGPTRVSGAERVNRRGNDNRHLVHLTSAVNHRHDGEQRNLSLRPQALEQLTIRSDWPQDGHTDGRSFIPTSQGLLTTARNAVAQTPAQRTAPFPPRLRLLQLQPPQPNDPRPPSPPVKEAWGPNPHPPSVHSNILPSRSRPSSGCRAEDTGRTWVEASAPPSHLHDDRERTGALRFPPAPHRAVPAVGLPLLRFHPDAQRTVTLPRVPQPTTPKPPNVGVAGTGHYPRLQLLRRDPDPPSAGMRINTPPVRTPRLIPLEELLRWAAGKQTASADGKLQLLKTDHIVQNSHTSSPSSKRRKRREEKNKNEKIKVTFRPEESIIPPDEILQPAEEVWDQNDGYVTPLGAMDSELTGQMLLDKMYSTSAELHAYASTQKRPPEIHDACTNTDPEVLLRFTLEPSRSITDKAVSVQLPSSPIMPSASTGNGGRVGVAPVVPPDVFLNLRFSKETSPDRPEGTDSNAHINAEGRRFINVIDLADDSSQAPNSPPSFAQLHLLAARAVNSAPINTKPILSTEELPGPAVRSSSPPAVEADDVLSGDRITLSVLSGVKIHSSSLGRVFLSRTQISERLTEMDAQLARLQDIADNIDKEFADTRLLTIETQNPVMMPRVERKPYSRHVTTFQEVKNDNPSMMNLGPAAIREPADEEILSSTVCNQSSAPGEHSPPAVKQEQRVQDTDGDLTESLFEDPEPRADETLGLTGLSDVKDILSELIRDGVLSRSALGLSQRGAHTCKSSSCRSEVKQGGVMMEEERRDVRIWMRRKQRERLMKYHKEREEKREQEHRPFTSPLTHNPSSVDLATTKKTKQEKDKMILQEHYEQRARDACSLITDLLTTPINLPTKPQERLPQRSSSQSSMRNKKSPKGQTGPYRRWASSLGKTVVLQRKSTTKPNGSLSNRFGLHRPASGLPGDRLSQVTRRGILTDLKARQETKTNHRKLKNGFQPSTVKDQTRVEDWNPEDSAEVSSILGLKDKENKQGFEEFDEAFAHVDPLRDLVGFDALSDSTGSVLSKLDWAAIEKIVAEEEDQ